MAIPWEWEQNTELGMEMGGNGKPPQWEWELPALPLEFIPTYFHENCGQFSVIETIGLRYTLTVELFTALKRNS